MAYWNPLLLSAVTPQTVYDAAHSAPKPLPTATVKSAFAANKLAFNPLSNHSHDSLRFGGQRRCLYCGISLSKTDAQNRFPTAVVRRVTDLFLNGSGGDREANRELLRAELARQVPAEQIRLRQLLGQALDDSSAHGDLTTRIQAILAGEGSHVPITVAVDHIRNRVWGGQTRQDNLFLDVCQKCNGHERGFIPFGWFIRGFGGKIVKDLSTQGDTFEPTDKPVLSDREITHRQANVAAGLASMIVDDVRIPQDNTWVRQSLFMAALPNMMYDPREAVTSKNLGERLRWLLEPLIAFQPKIFLSRDGEEYVHANSRGRKLLARTLLDDVIFPMRRARKKPLDIPDTQTG